MRKEAEKVKGGEDRVEEIIAAKMRDMNVASVGAIKIPEHCIVNSRAHMSKCAAAVDRTGRNTHPPRLAPPPSHPVALLLPPTPTYPPPPPQVLQGEESHRRLRRRLLP